MSAHRKFPDVVQAIDERDRKFCLLRPESVAALLSLSLETLKDMRKKRSQAVGPAWVKIGRTVRYPLPGVRAYIRKLRRRLKTSGKTPRGA
jgi:hypothetical protein